MISNNSIEQVLDSSNIVEVVEDYLTLKKRGANFLGLCPFHNEKTPSFTVSPAKGIYKCFGCGKAGNSSKFLMEHEQMSFPDAIRYLAKKYQIELEETERTPEEKEMQSRNESLIIANSFAQKYFSKALHQPDIGHIAMAYLKERGFSDEIIKKFQIGFKDKSFTSFHEDAKKNGFKDDILLEAGLIANSKKGGFRDFFIDRVMFPIRNISGNVLGFGGRTLKSDPKSPKYINTQDTPVYDKSRVLFGIHFSRKEISNQDECFVVEGYTDVISLHQGGIENVVASSGTSLTEGQLKLIGRFTKNVTLLFDGDPAGVKAALRGLDLILELNLNARVVMLPEGEDPDSFLRKSGANDFIEYVQSKKKDFILFKTNLLLEETQNDPVKKVDLIRDVIESISLIPDNLKRTAYLKSCSEILDYNEEHLIIETNKIRKQRNRKKFGEKQEVITPIEEQRSLSQIHKEELNAAKNATPLLLEQNLIRILLDFRDEKFSYNGNNCTVIQWVVNQPLGKLFENEICKNIFDELKQDPSISNSHFISHQNAGISSLCIDLLTEKYELSQNWEAKFEIYVPNKEGTYEMDLVYTVKRIKMLRIQRKLMELDEAMKKVHPDDEATLLNLMEEQKIVHNERTKLLNLFGTVVLN